MSSLRRGQVVHKKTRRDKIYNNLSTTTVKKIPRWASLAAVGSNAGMIGNIILDRSTGAFCYHNGIDWVCMGSNFGRIHSTSNEVINIIRGVEVAASPQVKVIDATSLGSNQIIDITCEDHTVIAIPDAGFTITINLPDETTVNFGERYLIKAVLSGSSDVILHTAKSTGIIRLGGETRSSEFSFKTVNVMSVDILYTQQGIWDVISYSQVL